MSPRTRTTLALHSRPVRVFTPNRAMIRTTAIHTLNEKLQ